MINTKAIAALAMLALCSAAASAELVVYEAGKMGKMGPVLKDGATFCPKEFSSKGFTVVCKLPPSVSSASFLVNGVEVRTEMYTPYTIAGDTNGDARAWTNYPMKALIVCKGNTGSKEEKVTASVTFACGDESKKPDMEPKKHMEEKKMPMGEKKMPPMKPPKTGSDNLIVIPATSLENDLPADWVRTSYSVAYKPNSDSTVPEPKGTADLKYTFKVKKSGTYAVTLDMTTAHGTDYNDVYLKFPSSGFTLRRGDSVRKSTDYEKAYHNRNGRATEAFAIDNDPHAFSTLTPLTAGMTYTIIVGARSTKVKLNSIVLFPCEGASCDASKPTWREYVKMYESKFRK